MITRFWLGARRPGLTLAQFSDHWHGVHGRLGLALPGLRAYVQNHPLSGTRPTDASPLIPPVFDGCSELDFDDLEAMRSAFASPAVAAADEDELLFADPDRFAIVVTERRTLLGASESDTPARSLTFVRVNPRRTRAELVDRVERLVAEEAGQAGAVRAEVLVALDDTPEPQACDAVLSLWFPNRTDLLAAAPTWATRCGEALVGLAFGRETALVEPRRMR